MSIAKIVKNMLNHGIAATTTVAVLEEMTDHSDYCLFLAQCPTHAKNELQFFKDENFKEKSGGISDGVSVNIMTEGFDLPTSCMRTVDPIQPLNELLADHDWHEIEKRTNDCADKVSIGNISQAANKLTQAMANVNPNAKQEICDAINAIRGLESSEGDPITLHEKRITHIADPAWEKYAGEDDAFPSMAQPRKQTFKPIKLITGTDEECRRKFRQQYRADLIARLHNEIDPHRKLTVHYNSKGDISDLNWRGCFPLYFPDINRVDIKLLEQTIRQTLTTRVTTY